MNKDKGFDLQQLEAKSSVDLLKKYKIKVENDKNSRKRKEGISNQGKFQQPTGSTEKQSTCQEKYIVPDKGKKAVYAIINDAWRRYKCIIKKNHFKPFKTLRQRLKSRPDDIPKEHFKALMEYWRLKPIQAISQQNAQNIAQQKCRHRAGPISFARIRERMCASTEDREPPSQAELFIETRQSKKGKEIDPKTKDVVIKLQDLVSSGQSSSEAFQKVVGKEKPGRLRCHGRTTTATMLKRNEEILEIKRAHANEMRQLKEAHASEMKELKEQNEIFQEKMEEKFQNFVNSVNRNNSTRSSASTHAPNNQEENKGMDDLDVQEYEDS